MSFDKIVSAALLGTHGAPAARSALPGEVAEALPAPSNNPAAELLDAMAAVTLYTRAGVNPRRGVALPQPCNADGWRECSQRAADILAQTFEDRLTPLLIQWLELAAHAQVRPPHGILPKMLDAAATNKSLQPLVSRVIDERGRWLTQFCARWQFTSLTAEPVEETWHTGNVLQRAEALRTIRQTNAAQARELVAATWKDDGAEDRARWVDTLLLNLSDADEEFLESCLDDRSGRVRESAAALLARLPKSKFVARMIDRLRPLMAFTPGARAQLLKFKRGIKSSFEVRLPEAFDKAMFRDGMTEKPRETLGQKQWWLLHLVAGVPLDFWTNTYEASPEELIEAAPEEFSALLVRGWLASLARTPVSTWIEPLLTAAKSSGPLDKDVLRAVPPPQRARVVQLLLSSSGVASLPGLLEAWRPLDVEVSQAILAGVELRWILANNLHFDLHPSTLPTLTSRITPDVVAEHRRWAEQALTATTLRLELHKEFSP